LSALASQASFTFSAPKSTTHEIAIVRVGGGLMGQNLSEAALKRYRQLLDANEQALVHSVFRKLEIPNDMWGDAVEPRGVLVMGFDKPWSVTIGTVNNPDPLKVIFGDDHKGTVVMTVDVRLLTDIKKHESEIVQLEVEVGVAGMYECFKQIGGKGRLVLAPGAEHGILLNVILASNPRTYPYHDPDWQAAAKHYAVAHILGSLTTGITDEALKSRCIINCFAVSPIVPLNTNVFQQPAKGLLLAMHIKGVQFDAEDEAGGFGLIPAQPIPLTGALLTGHVSPDGLTPLTGPVPFRIAVKGLKGAPRLKADTWYAPSLAAEMEAEGTEFSKMRTAQRRAQRKATATYHARDWHDRGEEEGELSEGGASAASSTAKIRKSMGASRFDIR
jgi:hypothetical protein